MELLTWREEQNLSEIIVSTHPHKALIGSWLPRYQCIKTIITRKGWGRFKSKYAKTA